MSDRHRTIETRDAPAATETVRHRICEALREGELSAHELSQKARVREREVAQHLAHLAHTLARAAEQLVVAAPHCVSCGFSFAKREKLKRPSRCPRCKSERISPPTFSIRANAR